MNEEIIFYNLAIIIRYLGITTEEFSIMIGKEKSYYRTVVKCRHTIPDLKSIIKICEYCDIKIDDFVNKKLKLEIVFEENKEKGE